MFFILNVNYQRRAAQFAFTRMNISPLQVLK